MPANASSADEASAAGFRLVGVALEMLARFNGRLLHPDLSAVVTPDYWYLRLSLPGPER